MESDQPVNLINGNTADYGVSTSGVSFSSKRMQWMSSSDAVSWTYQGVVNDPSTGQAIRIWTDNVNVGYDPARAVFALTWIDNAYQGRLMTMPAPGSPQTSNVYSVLPNQFWETPSISCASGASVSGCQLVGSLHVASHGSPLNEPYVITYQGAIQASGLLSVTASISNTDIRTTHAPSVSYVPSGDAWVMAYIGVDGGSLYTTRKQVESSQWPLPGGPILVLSSAALSAPSLGYSATGLGRVGLVVAPYGP